MIQIRPTSSPATAAVSGEALDETETAGPSSNTDIEQAATSATDVLAKFGAFNGLHEFAHRFADPGRTTKDPWARDEAAPSRNAPVLYINEDGVPAGNATKAPPQPQGIDITTIKQSDIDALKKYPDGMTQADVDKLTRHDISRAAIEEMKKSKDPKTVAKGEALERDRAKGEAIEAKRRLGITIENAKVAYADLLGQKPPAKIYVTQSAGNGGQPVLVLVAPGFDFSKPAARVHTHYHGDNATVADPAGSKAGTNARIADSLKREPQSVWVLPESVARPQKGVEWPQQPDTPTHDGYYKASWDNVHSQVQTTSDALKAAGVDGTNSKQVVSFHSRGGEALMNIMKSDSSGNGLKADRLELLDCLYGSQYSAAAWGDTANGKAAGRVVFYRGTNDVSAGDVIAPHFKTPRGATTQRFETIDVSVRLEQMKKKDRNIEDKVNPVYTDGTSKKYYRGTVEVKMPNGEKKEVPVRLRQFEQNPHYRTTGQFMDTEPGP